MKKPTLIDVARIADVSAITVSRTLRDPERVSESTRIKVQAAVEELGYVPDSAASTLASKRSTVIGMLVPSFSNNVFSQVLAGAYDAIEGTKYSIQIGNTRYSALKEEEMVRRFLTMKPAGMIVAGVDQTEMTRKLLKATDCPVVQVMDIADDPIDSIVGFSNFQAAAEATYYMIQEGFRRIAFVGTRMDPRTQMRMAGYRSMMEKSGLYDPALQITTQIKSSVEIGRHLLGDILSTVPDCDAVFCNNDDVAVGIAFECERRNIRIPQDMGICGFNDLGTTSQMNPAVTSVHTPRVEIGKVAAQIVIDANAKIETRSEKIYDLGFELKKRASTNLRGAAFRSR
ncbi:LacI family DNA-binding transcriptional regulator [Falsihalocynthiibacter arcticus]|uniref:Transcriptional regulator n=1 Tax=Falsihalocynthiibacter arcticus TaxID=1579316 RepID=A0A126V373_9RHOB|nr:LacI family DNA-binding transcriptional regulator [Falsihalocynthiibacter arcticus]AML52149.1 transcriptional regulator [Falsihalocynthiibacter arcticus]